MNNMNIVEFNFFNKKNIVFCMVDTINTFKENWIKEIIKNQSDYTISNIYSKQYTLLQGLDEDNLIKYASEKYDYACVFSTGTEFINGNEFFKNIELECTDNFLIKGHILDRGDAYYELHQQCYLINLKNYKLINCPKIGYQQIGNKHKQIVPLRSLENIHDDYTPLYLKQGFEIKEYSHKCHGWNIISIALQSCYKIETFSDNIRKNKKHLYPESSKDFYKHVNYVYFKERYCNNEYIHTSHTENPKNYISKICQVIAPASGEWYKEMLDTSQQNNVIIYDYNEKSLDYWRENVTKTDNIKYQFIKLDLLGENIDLTQYIDTSLENQTLINLSNIFCYEGTATLTNTKYRLFKENQILINLKEKIPNAYIYFSLRTSAGFVNEDIKILKVKDITIFSINDFKKPTWHINEDWLSF